jgi:Ni,Fe-hydrogenase III large subunit/Ni,Fe-hydrogenase III component G
LVKANQQHLTRELIEEYLGTSSPDEARIGLVAKEIQDELPTELRNGIISSEIHDSRLFLLTEHRTFTAISAVISRNPGVSLKCFHASDERDLHGNFRLYVIFDYPSNCFVIVATDIDPESPSYDSLTPYIYAANWYEREIRDMFGIEPTGHPDPRPLVLYDDWPEGVYPLRKDFAWDSEVPRVPTTYNYKHVEGEGVFEIPVGPVHAGIIEPGHFRFSVAGEPILNLEIRLGYVYKGIEKLSENMPYANGVFLAERISGDNSFSHATAYCQAVENLVEAEVPDRAKYLRTIYLELERLYNLCRDVAGIALVTAHNVGAAHGYIMQEQVMQLNECLTGSRFLRGVSAIGGVKHDISEASAEKIRDVLAKVESEIDDFYHLITIPSLLDRTQNTGIISKRIACDLNLVGPVARASGMDRDVRRDHPYAAYPYLDLMVITEQTGDVQARLMVKLGEIYESMRIIKHALARMPIGPISKEIGEVPRGAIGFSAVETPRGEAFHWIMAGDGKPYRHKIRDPSYYNWLAMEWAVLGNIVPDFPLINKSMNLSYAGNDL